MDAEIKSNRNDDLDVLRGVAMLWVLLVHCLYWVGIFKTNFDDIMKSFLLIEMPLFFFIAGASNAMGRKKSVLNFYIARFQRVLIPYWIYALICFVITITFNEIKLVDVGKYLTIQGAEQYFKISLPDIFTPICNLHYLTWALWFVPIYLLVMLFFPLFRWYFNKYENYSMKIIPLLVLAIAICAFTLAGDPQVDSNIKMVLFYGFWTYMGLFFQNLDKQSIKEKLKVIPIIVLFIMGIITLLLHFTHLADMQNNKFPPNFIFLVYTFGALTIFYLCFGYIVIGINFLRKNRVFNWIFAQYVKNGYTIFLYHPFAFLIAWVILRYTGLKSSLLHDQWLCLFVYLLWVIPVSALLGKLFSWGERIGWYTVKNKDFTEHPQALNVTNLNF